MTVGELIEELGAYPRNALVFVDVKTDNDPATYTNLCHIPVILFKSSVDPLAVVFIAKHLVSVPNDMKPGDISCYDRALAQAAVAATFDIPEPQQ